MEFKFRAIDEQPSTHVPTSSGYYFREQAFRGPNLRDSSCFSQNPSNVREAIQRELEKEQIRVQIIAAEIARKRLEEREIGSIFSGSVSLPFSSAMRFDPRSYPSDGRSFEDRMGMLSEESLGYHVRHGSGEALRFQSNVNPKISVFEPPVFKEKVIFLAKPEGNFSGEKRKAVTSPATGASELPSIGLTKKSKVEGHCALCQVNASSERALNEHLLGRKHRMREAGLQAQRTGKNYAIEM